MPAVGGSLAGEIVGVWQGNGSPFTAAVFHADGTQVLFKSPEDVLNPGDTETAHYRVSGDTLEITIPDPRARSCLFTYSGQRLGEGRVEVTAVGQTGLGCLPEPLAAPFTIVRISPVSPAGLAYSRPTDNTLTTVASLNSVRGTWLLKGTGVVLAIGQISITTGIGYQIDHEGTIDYGADDQGTPTVSDQADRPSQRQPRRLRGHHPRQRGRRRLLDSPPPSPPTPATCSPARHSCTWIRIQ